MKRLLFFLAAFTVVVCASASNKYVKPDGDDSKDGKSWEKAFGTVKKAISNCPAGDTVFIAEGVYNQKFSVNDGQTILGGYNPTTGERDIELYPTVIDGTDIGSYVIVKYGGGATSRITIDGLTLQNAQHTSWGGGAIYMRYGMTLSNCIIRNCQGGTAGAIYIDNESVNELLPIVSNCIIELCTSGSCAAIYNNGGIIENCIVRGCTGSAGAIRNETSGSIVRNCLLYNNSLSNTWPNSAIYNKGTVINCTVCNNYGDQYPGIHSEGTTHNSVFWGNRNPDGFSDEANYINGPASTVNVADEGFGKSSAFLSLSLAADNNDAAGPNFRNPTTFVGAPTNDGEIVVMQNADFSLTDASEALLNKGNEAVAPEKDIDGVARPKGSGIDIGAYEFDPDAAHIPVTGVSILQTSIEVIEGRTAGITVVIEPANANNKRVNWSIDDPTIATIKNGIVTGVKVGETVARVETQDGGFKASVPVIVLPVPPSYFPHEVLEADELYKIEDYTIPTFIPFLIAKEAARIDSLEGRDNPDIALIAERLEAMYAAIDKLQGKEEPYNMIANFNGDPATHMGFCWFTNEGVKEGKVQLLPQANATAEDFETCDCLITLSAEATTTPAFNYAVSTSGIAKAAGLPFNTKFTYVSHKALAENLTPGTAYSWRVGYDGHWSKIAQFRTKEANQGDFSFLYMSDSHIQDAEYVNYARWCATAAAKNEGDVNFCVFPGDFVETGTAQNTEWEWERWFEECINPVIMKMPMIVTDGNHDDSENLNYDYHFNTNWDFYNSNFSDPSIPSEYKPQFHGITYSFVYGDVLFLVYSLQDWWRCQGSSEKNRASSYLSVNVANWFKEQVAKYPNTKYRVTLSHKNIFSGSSHGLDRETPMFRDIMLPIFKECEIDLAIQGHDHTYEVIGPVDPDTRTTITSAISGVENDTKDANKNATGKKGGTFVTDDGTLYFIGATCGRKRYYPHSEAKMSETYTTDPSLLYDGDHHDVNNYFSLFTSKFGQPGSPSYTRFNVTSEGIELKTYATDELGNATEYNTIMVKRTKPHAVPTGWEDMQGEIEVRDGEKFIRNGQLFILKDGRIYNVIGQEIAQ